MRETEGVFIDYLKKKGLRYTGQRRHILSLFLRTERHVTTEEFYRIVRENYKDIGFSTVFRTMRHICESGIGREIDLGDGIKRFEHKLGHEHHDHLICIKCGRFIEVLDPEIEKLQEKIAAKHNFQMIRHKMELFGYCNKCK